MRWRRAEHRAVRLDREARCRSARQDHGSATVVALAVLGVILVVAGGVFTLVGAVVASHRAHAAADLSALAGAAAIAQGEGEGTGCARAAAVARRNDAAPVSCRAGPDLSVEVVVSVEVGVPGLGAAAARARAGPAPSGTGGHGAAGADELRRTN